MIKCLIDRKMPTKESIAKRQDFDAILKKVPRNYTINSPWFYGAIGFSSVLLLILLIFKL
jgi:hypothetical protein